MANKAGKWSISVYNTTSAEKYKKYKGLKQSHVTRPSAVLSDMVLRSYSAVSTASRFSAGKCSIRPGGALLLRVLPAVVRCYKNNKNFRQ